MRRVQWAGLPIGIGLLLALTLHHGGGDAIQGIGQAGFVLLWLVPLHALPLLLDAHAWRLLLSRRAPLWFLWWIATVREAVSRLMPVASIGGEIVGIRLACWRVPDTCGVSASVIVEVLVTMAVQYAFSALGIVLIVVSAQQADALRSIGVAFLLSIPLPVMAVVIVRRGGIFQAIERWAAGLLGDAHPLLRGIDGAQLDHEVDALMSRGGLLLRSFLWQFAGYSLGSLETYLALAMLDHPVSVTGALAIEAITQAVRHAAFFIPAGLGVQDAAVVLLAQMFGVDREVALSLALVKRVRELVFGCTALASWQVAELVRERIVRSGSGSAQEGRVG
ncbi:lysylphosphatidylglycerol synthase domain-containing protein [Paraburkholderia aromaticivorans]|uniref:lysylphosphatidylglycerol synthase domain-containing protein n=1 Tax=Paraburkholderia aromaticivorans TaxID=2026199 RepID=UPI0014561AA8|nr:lysylphosphatidylglycerol synthase domain-containing protein [Paraburkholderia aromaticivorans]